MVVRSKNLTIQLHMVVHRHRALCAFLRVFHLPALHGCAALKDGALQGEACGGVGRAVVLPMADEARTVAAQRYEVPTPDEVHVVDCAAGDGIRATGPWRMLDVGEAQDVLVCYDVSSLAAHAAAVPLHEVTRHECIGHLPLFADLVAVENGHAAEHALEHLGAERTGFRAAPLVDPGIHFLDRRVDGDG